jgi:LmbE family N-acetylglucosaminyl deacetylase
MMHLYLSPHLDDAVLSCGAAIHRHVAAGDAVQVITFFAGEAEAGAELSPFAQEQHRYWGSHPTPMRLRRAEDQVALIQLGAEGQPLDYRDAVYRTNPEGEWMYVDVDTLLGHLQPGDALAEDGAQQLAEDVSELVSPDHDLILYAPLAVGRHVDHQIVHSAGERLLEQGYRVAFYEDYPYAERAGALETALGAARARPWHVENVRLDAADLTAKVSALGYYRSQMAVLFGGAEAMPSRVWAFAASRSPGTGLVERLWWPGIVAEESA